MASNTTNLALYKKDPITDGADTFNITTMLNENWDKIDAAVAQANKITAKSANATLTAVERGIVEVTTGTSVITITLPTAATAGLRYTIKKVDAAAGSVTVATTSSQTIDGVTTKILNARFASLTVVSNGSGWDIIVEGVVSPWGDNTRDLRSRCLVSNNANQGISANVSTKILYQSIGKDNLAEWSNVNNRFTAKSNSTYDIKGVLTFSAGMDANTSYLIQIFINGGNARNAAAENGSSHTTPKIPFSATVDVNAGDYVEIYLTTSLATTVTTGTPVEFTKIA